MAGVEKPRQIAVRILKRHAQQADYVENLLEQELAGIMLSPADRRLVQELAFGVVRWQVTLDWLIAEKTPGRTQKTVLQILLRLGLYQMFWLERIPDHAIVHETVEMARQLGFGPQAGFVNALLRGYLREREETAKKLAAAKTGQPPLGYSHPEWLCQRWQKRWGEEKLRPLLEWNNTPPVTYARLNTLRGTGEQLMARWQQEGVRFVPRQWDWIEQGLMFELQSHPPLAALPSFEEGWFYIQDPSTLLAVVELNPQPADAVLDLCAAPGGKTTLIAQLMNNRGIIMAQDPHIARRDLIRDNCLRLGVTTVRLARPSTNIYAELSEPYDRVLVDAPCSNTGVMRRRVDLRWRIRPEEIERLHAVQLDLLETAAVQVKPGGTLVYSTCSLEPEENEEVVKAFLEKHDHFRLQRERTLLPFIEGVDGAYVARITTVS
jgi:16S rRNA (cytosine967-C5)-methyltransferase